MPIRPDTNDGTPRREHYLHPARLLFATEPTQVITVLGSCVAVLLFDAAEGIGGVNHFLLPHFADGGARSNRFGNVAMEELITGLRTAGARPSRTRAKVFGGASVLRRGQDAQRLGERNVEIALATLKTEGIEIAGTHIGGTRGRKVVLHTDTGAAWVRAL